LRKTLWDNVGRLHGSIKQLGLTLAAEPAPVISVLFPNKETAFAAWGFLLEKGVYVNLAIPPGTPNATSLLRLSVSAAHQNEDMDKIIDAYTAMASQFASAKVPMPA